jgi:IclR family pca regulon transcriptional regulator
MQNTVSNPTEDAPKTPQRKSPTSATASDADTDLETDRGVETAPETEAETELEIDAEKEVEVRVEVEIDADEEIGSKVEPSTPAKPLSIAEQINALTDPSFMTSLARGLAVIKAFSDHRRAMTIAQLSQKTGIPRAAVRRCLYTLKQLGYADSEANNFFLKPGILALGYAFLSSTPLTVAAQPYLTELSHRLKESCVLAVLDQNEVMYVARSHTSRVLSLALNTGSRLPAYCTAIGRVLLAGLSANQLDRYFSSVVLTPHTERTVVSEQKLRDILFEVRRRGFAVVEEELEIGLRSIAVPVRGASGATVAALSIGAQVGRISRDEIEDLFLPSLLNASNEICLLLP